MFPGVGSLEGAQVAFLICLASLSKPVTGCNLGFILEASPRFLADCVYPPGTVRDESDEGGLILISRFLSFSYEKFAK